MPALQVAQPVQETALAVVLNVPASQVWHTRSVVAVGSAAT